MPNPRALSPQNQQIHFQTISTLKISMTRSHYPPSGSPAVHLVEALSVPTSLHPLGIHTMNRISSQDIPRVCFWGNTGTAQCFWHVYTFVTICPMLSDLPHPTCQWPCRIGTTPEVSSGHNQFSFGHMAAARTLWKRAQWACALVEARSMGWCVLLCRLGCVDWAYFCRMHVHRADFFYTRPQFFYWTCLCITLATKSVVKLCLAFMSFVDLIFAGFIHGRARQREKLRTPLINVFQKDNESNEWNI
jgi:hypothetical protein